MTEHTLPSGAEKGESSVRADGPGFLTDHDDLTAVREEAVAFIRDEVTSAGARGVVVGLSGGVDSTLTAHLAVQALGSDRVLGLGLPAHTDEDNAQEAQTMAEGLGIEFREVDLRPLLDLFEDHVAPEVAPNGGRRAIGNLTARLRMCALYYAANARSYLVCGTANRSELLLGYFTKYGDGGADLFPMGDLYKTEVQALAQQVGVPRRIVAKEPTADLWAGQTDAEDLGARYSEIDPVLRRVVDRSERVEDALDEVDASPETAETVARLYVDSLHKRAVPPTPGIDDRGSGAGGSHPLHLAPMASGL
ncbi:NAD+ synthase [Halosimplex litoreum]|uniref:NH(3)-dependent NAD(+) synthetase n=1 Tax=Halosimplex litoreum TaxID=1198301 RepID=A0A7T3G178_9EURY|nr:NAD+ synthase [Halosimplex litoreum]QPV64490.1 NAD+ synthase [Halosimplex litoreum]